MPDSDTIMNTSTGTTTNTSTRSAHLPLSAERQDLLESLQAHRNFLRRTAAGLTDVQAAHASTVSTLICARKSVWTTARA